MVSNKLKDKNFQDRLKKTRGKIDDKYVLNKVKSIRKHFNLLVCLSVSVSVMSVSPCISQFAVRVLRAAPNARTPSGRAADGLQSSREVINTRAKDR